MERVMQRSLAGRAAAALFATLLAIALAVSPPVVRNAQAATDPLLLEAAATYTLDPGAGRVHVRIDVKATNRKPNSAQYIYFYRELAIVVQPEATAIKASDDRGSIGLETRKRAGYIESTVRLRANLYYRDSTRFSIRYDLVDGGPRSDSDIRVGAAFASFDVWAWGDAAHGSVEVRLPAGFASDVLGDPLESAASPAGEILTVSPAIPSDFYAIVTADNEAAYHTTRITVPNAGDVIVMSWPEDTEWDRDVSDRLRRGLPLLQDLTGLDWPIGVDIKVRERFAPLLEGYAGFFNGWLGGIVISEELDPIVTLHEASHAWFNHELLSERWMYEGLASEYAWRVETALGNDPYDPEPPSLTDPGAGPLYDWVFPDLSRGDDNDASEQYGYNAAWWVMHTLYEAVGESGMQRATIGSRDNLIAYVGAGAPEKVPGLDDWRQFLDLAEDVTQPDPATVEDAFRELVVRPAQAGVLSERRAARDRYRALLEAGAGWLPPIDVRRPMNDWRFGDATAAMTAATELLELRDDIGGRANALGVEPGDGLKAAYEASSDGFVTARSLAERQLSTLVTIGDARAGLDAETDFVGDLGLLGETPETTYQAAIDAFESGNLEAAAASAAAAAGVIMNAAAVGQQRLVMVIVAIVVTLLFLVLLLIVLLRRRGRRQALALAAATAEPMAATAEPILATVEPMAATAEPVASAEAYATLAADPAAEQPPSSASPPDDEGGHARGDSPADP